MNPNLDWATADTNPEWPMANIYAVMAQERLDEARKNNLYTYIVGGILIVIVVAIALAYQALLTAILIAGFLAFRIHIDIRDSNQKTAKYVAGKELHLIRLMGLKIGTEWEMNDLWPYTIVGLATDPDGRQVFVMDDTHEIIRVNALDIWEFNHPPISDGVL